MKKLLLGAAVAALVSAPALARVTTIEFTNTAGETQTWSFDDATSKATGGPDGKTYDYTFDEEARKLCATLEDGPLCATFGGEEQEVKVGASAPYEATNGQTGTATITGITE